MQGDNQSNLKTNHPNDRTSDCQQEKHVLSKEAQGLIAAHANIGILKNPTTRGYFKGPCGDSMQIDLLIENDTIVDAKFLTDGCDATYACGSMITTIIRGKTTIQALKLTPEDLLKALEGLPEDHVHCATLAVTTLREALFVSAMEIK
ncbi:MAG: iron-sulfur cluster assembly scaffold protein [Bacteroidales bacterium]|nr:iron-sulfur cluster assembly scaffold protein [Bacteroidales bacterium]